jgi:uncharacterized Zn finger protein (UPF0148 family)
LFRVRTSEFARVAVRERLREKYERDQQKRAATEQMSELLLQGATMTDRHCPECHSPVFRYDGQEFCPTCQREVTEEGELVGEESGQEPGAAADAAANGETAAAEPADDAGAEADAGVEAAGTADESTGGADAGVAAGTEPADDRRRDPTTEARAGDEQPARTGNEDAAETRPAPARDRRPARVNPPARGERSTGDRGAVEGGDLGEAEASLVREITNLTRRAEETRDVGRKRDLFAAAREATETLRGLRRL